MNSILYRIASLILVVALPTSALAKSLQHCCCAHAELVSCCRVELEQPEPKPDCCTATQALLHCSFENGQAQDSGLEVCRCCKQHDLPPAAVFTDPRSDRESVAFLALVPIAFETLASQQTTFPSLESTPEGRWPICPSVMIAFCTWLK